MVQEWRKTWPADVDAFRPDVVVLLFGGWDYPDHIVNGATLKTGTPEWNAYVLSDLQTLLDSLTSQGAKLVCLPGRIRSRRLWASRTTTVRRRSRTLIGVLTT